MTLRLAGPSLAACLLASAATAAPAPAVRQSVAVCDPNNPQNCAAPSAAGQLPAADPNNAAYLPVSLTVGGPAVAATRGVAADCPAGAGGAAVLTAANGVAISWSVSQGHQNQPYAITAVASASGTASSCSFYGLR